MFEKESELSIKALDSELKRLHVLLHKFPIEVYDEPNKIDMEIFNRIKVLEDLLADATRRYNGLEY